MAVIENLDIVLGARTEKYDRGLEISRRVGWASSKPT